MSVAVVSIHDVAPVTAEESAHLLDLVERRGARASLLVVPGPWREPRLDADPSFVAWLHAAGERGHEVVAHGWEHRGVDDPAARPPLVSRVGERLLTRGCAEFAALGWDEARRRADRSRSTLTALGFRPTGFVAPGWSISAPARDAVEAVGFDYTTTRTAVVDLVEPMSIGVPAVCHRPNSALSMLGARMVVAIVEKRCRDRRSVRLALHPDDVHDQRLEQASCRSLDALAASALELVTYGELVSSCRSPRSAEAASTRGQSGETRSIAS